jgi:hypothetical protein
MSLALKPTHAAVKNYYAALHQVGQLHFNNEAQVSDAFAKLLADCGRKLHLTFIPQFPTTPSIASATPTSAVNSPAFPSRP